MKGTLQDHCFRRTWAWGTLACRSVALHCVGVVDHDALDMEGCQPHVALAMEDCHCQDALGELLILVDLVEGLVDVIVIDSSSLGLLREVPVLAHAYGGCVR